MQMDIEGGGNQTRETEIHVELSNETPPTDIFSFQYKKILFEKVQRHIKDYLPQIHEAISLSRSHVKLTSLLRWRFFSDFEHWPMTAFFRNPDIPRKVYDKCREDSKFGKDTSPTPQDIVWDDILEEGFVTRVRDYVNTYAEDFHL